MVNNQYQFLLRYGIISCIKNLQFATVSIVIVSTSDVRFGESNSAFKLIAVIYKKERLLFEYNSIYHKKTRTGKLQLRWGHWNRYEIDAGYRHVIVS